MNGSGFIERSITQVSEEGEFDDETAERTLVFDRGELAETVATGDVAHAHVFVRMDGSDIGQVTTLSGSVLEVGRLAKSQIHLPFEGVSRSHARLIWKQSTYVLEDLDSANGTFVQGSRVKAHPLVDGDVVQFGPRVVFRYSVTDSREERVLRQLYESSVKDALTGAFNREYLNERLKAEVAYARRHSTDLSLLMVDIDHFKKVNDTYGHPGGDVALTNTAAVLGRTLRAEDVLGRYGGEEFSVILRGILLDGAHVVAERLRAMVEASVVTHDGRVIRCTVSIGAASLTCTDAPAAESLFAVADRRLYAAKRSGRNRVVSTG
jgi:two-component system cell cycle response regulator